MEYQKWLAKLLGFDFEIEYKPRMENKAADALSRKESSVTLMALSVPRTLQLEEVMKSVEEDQHLSRIMGETLLYKDQITFFHIM